MFTHLRQGQRFYSPGDLPDSAGGLYNPGAWRGPDGLVRLIVRREATPPPYTGTVPPYAVCEHEVPHPVTLVGHHTDARLEDFRPLVFSDQVLVVHTTVQPQRGFIQPALSVFDEGALTLTRYDDLALPCATQPVEKNWVLFADGETLKLVYSLDPLLIYRRMASGSWVLDVWQRTDWTKALGKPPRNSANLLPFDSPDAEPGWLGWWHTQIDRTYVQGAYWLDANLSLRARTGILFNGQAVTDGFKPGCLYLSSQTVSHDDTGVDCYFGEGDAFSSVCTVANAALRRVLFPPLSRSL